MTGLQPIDKCNVTLRINKALYDEYKELMHEQGKELSRQYELYIEKVLDEAEKAWARQVNKHG